MNKTILVICLWCSLQFDISQQRRLQQGVFIKCVNSENVSECLTVGLSLLQYQLSRNSSMLRRYYLCNNMLSFSAFPTEDPMIEGVMSTYSVGDYLSANCTSGKSYPPAVLSWTLNGRKVCAVDLRSVVSKSLLA
jgi:hypothetical protein